MIACGNEKSVLDVVNFHQESYRLVMDAVSRERIVILFSQQLKKTCSWTEKVTKKTRLRNPLIGQPKWDPILLRRHFFGSKLRTHVILFIRYSLKKFFEVWVKKKLLFDLSRLYQCGLWKTSTKVLVEKKFWFLVNPTVGSYILHKSVLYSERDCATKPKQKSKSLLLCVQEVVFEP